MHSDTTLSEELQPSFCDLDSALARHSKAQPIIVDFDGTILLRNSTEAYLETAWPRPVAALLLALLDLIRPWRLFPGADRFWIYSDWTRVIVLTLLLPWTALLWQRRAASVARLYANAPLLERLALWPAGSLFVATFGFGFVVGPLLKAIVPKMNLVVAESFLGGFRLRRLGKAVSLRRAIGADALSASLIITDSTDDADLASVSAGLVMLDCPADAHRRALQDSYIPFHYLHTVKRPGEQAVVRKILYRDLWVLWISYALHSPSPLLTGAGLSFLQVSFWIIYEIGCWENDVIGALYEDRPVIRQGFATSKRRFSQAGAWAFALLIGLAGAVGLNLAAATHVAKTGLPSSLNLVVIWSIWIIYLWGVRSLFWFYNRIDPASRLYVYPALQITKGLGFVVLLPISLIGAPLCATLVCTQWIPYIFYRYAGTFWEVPQAVFQLTIFSLLVVVLALATDSVTPFTQLEFWFVVAWFSFQARKQILALFRNACWLPARRPNGRPVDE